MGLIEKRMTKEGIEFEVGWDGRPLSPYPYLAFDTETAVVDTSRCVPALATLQATNGRRHVIVHPDDAGAFVRAHQGTSWVAWNASFDWWVVHHHLAVKSEQAALAWWKQALDQGAIRDAMLLDFLVRLADPAENVFGMRNLGQAAAAADVGVRVDKKFEGREKYGELIGKDWAAVDPAYWDYAINDVIATHRLYSWLYQRLPAATGSSPAQHGPLTETLQVRADIVLADVGRRGFALNTAELSAAKDRLMAEIQDLVARLDELAPGALKKYKIKAKRGELMVGPAGVPKMDYGALRESLTRVARELDIDLDQMPKTEKSKQLTTSLDPWREVAGGHPLVHTWADLADKAKLHQFLVHLTGKAAAHTRYEVLKRTGRTSAKKPNIQQIPREAWMRALFVARPTMRLAIVDYSAIELTTLAAVCIDRYGRSVLGETIKAGRDPHAYTASLVQGIDYDTFLAMKKGTEEEQRAFKRSRQAAKAVNFGVPGGLGAEKLTSYAKANYGVDLTQDQAAELRHKLITQVYPELEVYLSDDVLARLARNLQTSVDRVAEVFRQHLGKAPFDGFYYLLDKVVAGSIKKKDGTLISGQLRTAIWDGLAELTKDTPRLYTAVMSRRPGPALWRMLLGDVAVTLTGRVRAGLSYTEARNTPFQGLAADGAKVALYRLWKAGYKIVAFVHDEVVCEVPAETAARDLAEIERIMIESMASVLHCDVPVSVEGKVAEVWQK